MNQTKRQTHLEFYREHHIAPVRYDLSSIDAHLERRFSLYAKLGLLPISFKGSKVLEVAAGTGHNSLYISQLMPSEFVLIEPNETAVQHLHNTYHDFDKPHTIPTILCTTLEDYSNHQTFDIVICENWLGTSQHEISLLKKISRFVSDKGIFVLTTVSPIGFIPNILRRFMASYLAPMNKSFEERTQILIQAFESHLDTLPAMTRNKIDWVQDNMINPAYFGLPLSIPTVINHLKDRFEIIGSCPSFSEDWRWFKGLYGQKRQFNQHFLNEYWKKAHHFLDYRIETVSLDTHANTEFENKALQLIDAVALHEDTQINQENSIDAAKQVLNVLEDFITAIPSSMKKSIQALNEAKYFIQSPLFINLNAIANLSEFSYLFGRETVYISLIAV
jgi:2-polyprenyl-3-methyl-5-hydroxy-6-metoxy-1,4-benzoquinol methylase